MKKNLKRVTIDLLGVLFIILGILGLILPFLQGIVFIVIGLYILSHHYEYPRRHVERIKKIHPRMDKLIHTIDVRFKKIFNIE